MKTKIFSMMALAAMLLGTSCSNDELNEPANGQPMTANFSVELPTGISARKVANGAKKAFADGKTATKLKYMVFDNEGKLIEGLGGEKDINLTATVQMQLTTGKEYKIVFWAANANAPYTLDDNGVVTVDYSKIKANDESLDAFYRCYDYKAGDDVENPIKLYRPFAQLNVGTNDMDAAAKTGFNKTAAQTEVKVSGIANKLDLLTGAVSGDAEVTYQLNAIPQGETFPKAGYDYLSMDYLLVGKEAKSNVDVKWQITDGANTVNRTFANVPVQGNYRTNIYGALLTSTTDFNVQIEPAFQTPDYEYKVATNYTDLKKILTDADAENIYVKVNGKIYVPDEFFTLGGANTANVVIEGNDDASELQFTNSYLAAIAMKNLKGLLTLKNLKVSSTRPAGTWNVYDITFWQTSVEMENVHFSHAVALTPFNNGGFKTYNPDYKVTMKNCTITDPRTDDCYALWIQAGAGNVTLDGCTISGNRAIKVADQYVTEDDGKPVEVYPTILNCNNCKFVSSKKAAVYSSTIGGGTFTFTGTNDITGVKADTKNHVWIDPGYASTASKIKVVGATFETRSE